MVTIFEVSWDTLYRWNGSIVLHHVLRCCIVLRDGWRVQNFHSKCDGKGATLTAIKTANGCVFGGFSDVTWDSQGRNTTSSKAWLFSIKSLAGTPPQKMPINPVLVRARVQAREFQSFQRSNANSIMTKINTTLNTGTYATFRAGKLWSDVRWWTIFTLRIMPHVPSSYSNLDIPHAIPPGTGNHRKCKVLVTFLAGTYNFTPVELEVYSISDKL